MPTTHTAAVRIPARMTGAASGSSTLRRIWAGVMPMALAASTSAGSTPSTPATVLRTTGSIAYSVSAIPAGSAPRAGTAIPAGCSSPPRATSTGTISASRARPGMVWTRPVSARTGPRIAGVAHREQPEGDADPHAHEQRNDRDREVPRQRVGEQRQLQPQVFAHAGSTSASSKDAWRLGASRKAATTGWPGSASRARGAPTRTIAPRLHHRDPIRQQQRLGHVVRHHHRREPEPIVQRADLLLEQIAGDRIEGPERLVHQQDRGLRRERPRDAHPLPLPARERRRRPIPVDPRLEADRIEQFVDPFRDPGRRPAHEPGHGADVLAHRPVREQADRLHHVADAPAQRLGGPLADVRPVDEHPPLGRLDEAVDGPQRRRLAAARAADQRDPLPLGDGEVHPPHRPRPRRVELLADRLQRDLGVRVGGRHRRVVSVSPGSHGKPGPTPAADARAGYDLWEVSWKRSLRSSCCLAC